ncbi:MAG: type II toxin-antitoxin system RelE/ParE family toxin [Nitrospinae bacterium]|nr:type II toxin-antitoxin system RelE/ParE family toxin [Nitrospinota bacterium]
MLDSLREIAWVKNALKEFEKFPLEAKRKILGDLTLAAEGEKGDISKPLKGLGVGVFEVALKYRKDAYRTVYALQIDEKIWVVHVFKKKSKTGIKTSQKEMDLIKSRIKLLKNMKS